MNKVMETLRGRTLIRFVQNPVSVGPIAKRKIAKNTLIIMET